MSFVHTFELNNWNSSNKGQRKINFWKNWKVKRKHWTNFPNKFLKAQRNWRFRALFYDVKTKKRWICLLLYRGAVTLNVGILIFIMVIIIVDFDIRLYICQLQLRFESVCVLECKFEVKKRYLIYVTSIFDSFEIRAFVRVFKLFFKYFAFFSNILSFFGTSQIVDVGCVPWNEMYSCVFNFSMIGRKVYLNYVNAFYFLLFCSSRKRNCDVHE